MTTAPGLDVEAARSVERAVLDYFEGWFEGDATRMERALHPALAKRDVVEGAVRTLTARQMIDATAAGSGRARDVPDRRIEIDVVDLAGANATVVVRSAVYREYLHLVATPKGWKILNALWQWA